MRGTMWMMMAMACSSQPERLPMAQAPVSLSLMTLTMDPLIPGEPVAIEVYNAFPGSTIDIVRSNGGLGAGPCPALLGGGCLGMLPGSSGYIPTLRGRADAEGRASWALASFPNLPFSDWSFQAVSLDAGNSNLSNALARPIGGGCIDDGFEHNDTDVTAALLAVGGASALVACPGDDDWYEIPVPAGQVVRVDASFATAEGDLDLRLFDSLGAEVDRSVTVLGDEVVEWHNVGPATTVLLRAYLFDGGETGYALDVQVGPFDAVCIDDPGEDNDIAADAVSLNRAPGVACALDDDWYVYDLAADEALVLGLEADGGAVDLLLYNSLGLEIGADLEPPHDLLYTNGRDETVWAVVRLEQDDLLGGGVDYVLDADVVTVGDCADDAFEPNDDSSSARLAPAGLQQARVCAGDEDWYRIPMLAGDNLSVEFDTVAEDGDVDVYLYDATGSLQASAGRPPYLLTGSATAGGSWRVQVVGGADDLTGDGVGYSWQSRVVTPDPCREDGYEPNDDVLSGTSLPEGEVRVGVACEGNEDWYRMPVSAGSTVRFTVDADDPEDSMSVFLLDAGGVQVAVETGQGSVSVERVGVPVDSDYLLRVVLTEDAPSGGGATYQVRGQTIDFDPCIEDRFEPNDDLASGVPTPAGLARMGVSCEGNADWYGTLVGAGDQVRMSLDYAESDGELDLFVYDAAGQLVTSDTFPPHAVEFFAESAGAYYAEVVFDGDDVRGGGVTYELTMEAAPPAPCTVDALEPNDSDLEAVTIATGALSATVCTADSDWYEFVADLGDLIIIDAHYITLAGDQDVDLVLYDDALGVLDEGDFDLTTPETVDAVAPYTGRYFVEVIAGADDPTGGGVDYDLDVFVGPIGACVVDGFEPNNSLGMAATTGGVPQDAEICAGDDDWWYVDATAGDLVSFALTYSTVDGSLDLLLFDANGVELDADVVPPNAVSAVTSVTGRVYARVSLDTDNPPTTGVAYRVGSQVDAPATCLSDAQEPDNSLAAATPLGAGSVLGGTACTTDSDWVAVDASAGDRLSVFASYATLGATQDVDLNLYSDAGVLLDSGDLDLTAPEVVEVIAPYTGTYYVEVFAERDDVQGGGVDYSLSVSRTSLAVCVDDGFEPNNTTGTATALAVGQTRAGQSCSADDDVYAVPLGAGEAAVFSVTYAGADGEVDLELRDSSGTVLVSDAFAPVILSYQAVQAETVYAVVLHDRDDTIVGGGVSYSVGVTGLADCVADAEEPNDSIAEASTGPGTWTNLTTCTEVGTSSNPGGDWFEVPLLTGEEVVAQATFAHDEGDIDLQIVSSTGAQLASASSSTDDELVSWVANQDGSVFVRARLWRDAGVGQFGNTYDLTISVP